MGITCSYQNKHFLQISAGVAQETTIDRGSSTLPSEWEGHCLLAFHSLFVLAYSELCLEGATCSGFLHYDNSLLKERREVLK